MPDHPALGDAIKRGLRTRCPRCGEGRLFAGFLEVAPRCERCGLDYAFVDSADGPAVFVILISGFIVVFAALIVEFVYAPPYWVHALLENDRQGLKWGLICTIALGLAFTAVQAYEYHHAAFHYSGHIYGATFFMATGFHGAHVIIGSTFLIVCLIRAYLGHFTPKQHLGFEFCAWYWHFVDVVWLFLFACIYVWGAGTPVAAVH